MPGRLANCIAHHGTSDTKPKWTKEFKAELSLTTKQQTHAVHKALTAAHKEKRNILAQINDQITRPSAESISQTEKDVTTTLAVGTKFNRIKAYFQAKSKKQLLKNAIQHYHNFLSTLDQLGRSINVNEFSETHIGDSKAETINFLRSFVGFTKEFTNELNQIYKVKQQAKTKHKNAKLQESDSWKVFRSEDLSQDLVGSDGKLLPNIQAAIAAGAYNWIATQAEATAYNDDRAIWSILGVDKESAIPDDVRAIVSEMGVAEDYLIEQLGSSIYNMLGIVPNQEGDHNLEARLKAALAYAAIGTLESQGILSLNRVDTGIARDAKGKIIPVADSRIFGLDWLKQRVEYNTILRNEDIHSPEKGYEKRWDKKTKKHVVITYDRVNFYTLNTSINRDTQEQVFDDSVQQILDIHKEAPHAWDQLFRGENSPIHYTFDKPKNQETRQIGQTEQNASNTQTENLNKYNQTPQEAVSSVFNVLLMFPTKLREHMLGLRQDSDLHVSQRKSNESKTRDIRMDWNNAKAWLSDAAKQPDGYKTKFYLLSTFMANTRAIMRGPINTQNSKMHRSMFNLTGQQTENIIPKANIRIKDYRYWMMGVGLGLGIEYSKSSTEYKTVRAVEELMQEEVMVKAVAALRNIIKTEGGLSELNPEKFAALGESLDNQVLQDISAGVLAGEEGTHSLRSLIEYAEFQEAAEAYKSDNKTRFTSSLLLEADGLANGPMWGFFNFIPEINNLAGQKIVKLIRNSGFTFFGKQKSIEKLLINKKHHDAYQNTAIHWSKAFNTLKSRLQTKGEPADLALLQDTVILEELIGELTEADGTVSTALRKINKDPTMQTLYGAGKTKIVTNFIYKEIIQARIYDRLIEISNESDQAKAIDQLIAFNNLIERLTEEEFIANPAAIVKNGTVKEMVLSATAEATIVDIARNSYGTSLSSALKEAYAPLIEARANINKGVELSVGLYNQVLKIALAKATQTIDGVVQPMSLKTYNEVIASVQSAIPLLQTPYKTSLELAKPNRERSYNKDDDSNAVRAEYNAIEGKKKVTRKQHTVSSRIGLNPAGARAPVVTIQMLDAIVANILSGHQDILNIYDGFFTGLRNINKVAARANKVTYYLLKKYDLAAEIHTATKTAYNNGLDLLKQFGVNELELQEIEAQILQDTAADFLFEEGTDYGSVAVSQYLEEVNSKEISTILKNKENSKTAKRKFIDAIKQKYYAQHKETIAADMRKHYFNKSANTAASSTSNKKYILDRVTGVNQYNYSGGMFKTQSTETTDNIFGSSITRMDQFNLQAVKEMALRIVKLRGFKNIREATKADLAQKKADQEFYNSRVSQSEDISQDPAAYDMAATIDQENVVDIYNTLKHRGPTEQHDSATHDNHLQGILKNIMAKVLKPIDMFYGDKINAETEGLYVYNSDTTDQVFMPIQDVVNSTKSSGALSHSLRMSPGEVYVHELLHAVLRSGLSLNSALTSRMQFLFDTTKAKLGADGYKYFLNDPDIDVTDKANAADVAAAKERYDHVFHNRTIRTRRVKNSATGAITTLTYSNHLAEFAAFGLSNENFIKKLSTMTIHKQDLRGKSTSWITGIIGRNVQDAVLNIFEKLMDKLGNRFSKATSSHSVASELQLLAYQLTALETKQKSKIFKIMDRENRINDSVTQYMNAKIKKYVMAGVNKWSVAQGIHGVAYIASLTVNTDNKVGKGFRKILNLIYKMDHTLFHSVLEEAFGRNSKFDPIYDLITTRETLIDSAQETIINAYIEASNKFFSRDLDPDEKVAVHNTLLKTDFVTLMETMTIQDIAEIFKSPEQLEKVIRATRKLIKKTDLGSQHHMYYDNSAEALGFYMITGQARQGTELRFNATQISTLNDTHLTTLSQKEAASVTPLIDKLASLYALQHTALQQRETVSKLMATELEGVGKVLLSHRDIQRDALIMQFNNSPMLMHKGYMKSFTNSYHLIEVGFLEDEEKFKAKGFVRHITPITMDAADPSRASKPLYYYIGKDLGGGNDRMHGAVSLKRTRSKGVSLHALYHNELTDQGDSRVTAITKTKRKHNAAFNKSRKQGIPTNVLPQYDSKGKFMGYRLALSTQDKMTHLEQYNEYDVILGSMRASLIAHRETAEINDKAISILHTMYLKDAADMPDAYVEVSPYSEDPALRDYYYLLPEAAKDKVNELFGSERLMIHKSILTAALGFRKYSFMDAYNKNPEDRAIMEKITLKIFKVLFKEKAAQRLIGLTSIATEMTSMAKGNVIIRTPAVTWDNSISNLMYLRSKGLYTSEMLIQADAALSQGTKYQADKLRLATAEIELRIVQQEQFTTAHKQRKQKQDIKELTSEIFQLRAALTNNPLRQFIESGGMPAMIDDVETTTTTDSVYPGRIEKAVKTVTGKLNKKSSKLKKGTDHMFLTENTEEFKVLNNAVKMTDFVARYILYKHYTSDTQGTKRKSHAEAMRSVSREFVNFSIPTHKMMEFGNNIGLLWYTKYQLRIFRVMFDSMYENPFGAMSTYAFSQAMGFANIFNSIPGVTKNLFQLAGTPLTVGLDSVPGIATMDLLGSAI